MMENNELTQSVLKDLLDYNPETGIFVWIKNTSFKVMKGRDAGCIDTIGYRIIRIDGKNYKAHRLAFLYVYGRWPVYQIDHADGSKSNNAIVNLRECNDSQNHANLKISKVNKTGFKGVHKEKGSTKWRARIKKDGKAISLGSYSTKEEAADAYAAGAKKHFGEFARTA